MLSISVMDAGSLWRENGKSKDNDSPDGSGKMSKYFLVIPYFLVRGHPSKGGWFPLNVLLHFSNREACNWLVTEL